MSYWVDYGVRVAYHSKQLPKQSRKNFYYFSIIRLFFQLGCQTVFPTGIFLFFLTASAWVCACMSVHRWTDQAVQWMAHCRRSKVDRQRLKKRKNHKKKPIVIDAKFAGVFWKSVGNVVVVISFLTNSHALTEQMRWE